jgi:hypothetical protein
MLRKKAQQEMVGFVLIVVLVVVGLMVFLVISLRSSPETQDSLEVANMLDALMKHTTRCAAVFEPQFDRLEDLFKRCYNGGRCGNLDRLACDVLNETLVGAVQALLKTEATVGAYQIDFSVKDSQGLVGILKVFEGDCSGTKKTSGAMRTFSSGSENLIIELKLCKKD